MRIIDTSVVEPKDIPSQWERDQVYNGFDTTCTLEILDVLLPQLDNHTAATYTFSKALQGPALEMRLRGVRVDLARKAEVIEEFHDKIETLERNLDRIVLEGVGLPHFNWRSNPDLHTLFYDRLGIPIIKKQGRPTVNREALEKMEAYTIARPIIAHMSAMRDLAKKISVLKTEIDPDGRMRTSYNIAGTSTGRFSSSFSEFGTGGNLQNVEESLRSIFIADEGMKFAKFDAKQIQSRIVGALEWNIFKNSVYLDACESSDLHTVVAKIMWPALPWTGKAKKDKDIAEQLYYRHYTYRFMCKKLGHGTNFDGKPPTLAAQTKIPLEAVRLFQPKYYQAFPCHHEWHDWTREQIRRYGYLISLTGRKRWFFGRRNDDATVREALAYSPQADESGIVNSAMLDIWRKQTATVMMHEHDGLVYQFPTHHENTIVPLLLKQLEYTIDIGHGRTLTVPYEAKTGWNRGEYDEKTNPDGLCEYTGEDQRKRSPQMSLLDRVVRRRNG